MHTPAVSVSLVRGWPHRLPRCLAGALLLLGATLALAAASTQELADARVLMRAGAVDLALERIERHQPRQSADPAWDGWETLRLEALAQRQRHASLLARFQAHGSALRGAARAVALVAAARAAAALGRFPESQALLLEAFAASQLPADEYRAARRAVIEACLAQNRIDAAYLAMLRYRQDFAPLPAEEAESFAASLLAAGRMNEAAGWLTQLDPDSPGAALLRLRAGLVTPAAALAQARARLAKSATESAWSLLAAAGRALGDPEIELEVLEGRLNARESLPPSAGAEAAAALWKAYDAAAERAANEAQLLAGDDAAWMDRANRLRPERPRTARALTAALSLGARAGAVRARAQLQLLESLREAKLARTAWRLFSDAARFPIAELDSQVRYELGSIAAELGDAGAALRYFDGLPPMDGMNARQWQARLLAVALEGGIAHEVTTRSAQVLDAADRLDAQSVARLISGASRALDLGYTEMARTVLQGLVAHATDAQRAALYAELAHAYETGGDPRAAAGAHLLAAAAAADPRGDPKSLAAREAAAANLLRAGLRADARAVWEWIARNARPDGAREAAQRRLERLPGS